MTQIFKTYLPTTDLLEFLLEICTISTDKYIQFNKNSFKRALYLNAIPAFLEKCKPHYHASKQKYIEGIITYKRLTTIIRQICCASQIKYTSKIHYDKSSYDIFYYFFLKPTSENT